MEKIIILGQGGHAASLVDILERQGKYDIAGYVVNNAAEAEDKRYPVIGCDDDLETIFRRGVTRAAVGIGYMGKSDLRERLWRKLQSIGFDLPVICDPSATVAGNADIGAGCFVGKGAVVNANASVGKMCIINSGAIVEHDCVVEDFSHVSVGTVLCGNVRVGRAAFIGANATVIQGRSIGDGCVVGAGEVVKRNLIANEVFARTIGGGYITIKMHL